MRRYGLIALLAAMGVFLTALPIAAVVVDENARQYGTQRWVGLGGFQFLKVGQGARPVGMGDAYAAVADDINAVFWNPAGLTSLRGTAWTASYTRWLVNSYLFSGAAAYNTGTAKGGVLGASVVAFRPETTEETTIYQPQGTGQSVSAGDIAIGVVYALKLTNKFSCGFRLSWIHQTLYTDAVSTVSLDIGTMFHTGFRSLRLAMALKNFGPDQKVTATKFFMPLCYNVGLSGEIYGEKGDPTTLTLSAESAYAADYEIRAHVGAEMWFQSLVALRAGYKFNYDTDSYSVGAGFRYDLPGDRSLALDVAYSDMGRFFTTPLRVTVGGTF